MSAALTPSRFPAVMLALAVLAGAGCSSSKSSTAASTGTTASPVTTASASSVPSGSAEADRINFRASDFPSTFTSTPPSAGGANPTESQTLDTCLGLTGSKRQDLSSTGSPTFGSAPGTEAMSNVTVVSPASVVKQEIEGLNGPKGLGCVQQGISAAAAATGGATLSNITTSALHPPAAGDGIFGVRISASASAAGQVIPVTIDVYFIAKGAVEVGATFTGAGQPFPQDIEQSAMVKLSARV